MLQGAGGVHGDESTRFQHRLPAGSSTCLPRTFNQHRRRLVTRAASSPSQLQNQTFSLEEKMQDDSITWGIRTPSPSGG